MFGLWKLDTLVQIYARCLPFASLPHTSEGLQGVIIYYKTDNKVLKFNLPSFGIRFEVLVLGGAGKLNWLVGWWKMMEFVCSGSSIIGLDPITRGNWRTIRLPELIKPIIWKKKTWGKLGWRFQNIFTYAIFVTNFDYIASDNASWG